MPGSEDLIDRLNEVRARIDAACRACDRDPGSVRLLAVSKTRGSDEVRAMHELGVEAFGENYVDEAVAKQDALGPRQPEWHFIGPVQSNKTRTLAERFDWVQSVDRVKIARRLADQRPADRPPLNVLVQVNIDDEAQKSGCARDDVVELAADVLARPTLVLRGLMAIPAATESPEDARPAFARLRALLDRLRDEFPEHRARFDTLSMGMSSDLESAIREGATVVRIGTALFGPRPG
ncbi:YggS family pyridoxal phosphate-dependent enzyme [Halomonas denitrificans]|nr:YggS family pyridoxal phosphate-dependent enzyme [Halomonas denitrificans]